MSAALLITQIAVLLQSLADDPLQFRGNIGIQPHRGSRRAVQNGFENHRRSCRRGTASRPVAISYSTAPKENRSLRASSSLARACSGDM